MHKSAYDTTKRFIDTYVPKNAPLKVADIGSRMVAKQTDSHRSMFEEFDCTYVGIDVADGPNVDVVMEEPYRIPLADDSIDVIVSGQVFEHIPYVWVTMMEAARILKPGGVFILSAPSRGHVHSPPYDAWRFYPDAYQALAQFSSLTLLEVVTDFPPIVDKNRFNYSGITQHSYWGDTVGAFEKGVHYDAAGAAAVREPAIAWANQRANITARIQPAAASTGAGAPAKAIKKLKSAVRVVTARARS